MAAGLGMTAGVAASCSSTGDCGLNPGHIQHGVIFSLKHEKGSVAERTFLEDGKRILTGIPVVRDFQVLEQVSTKNDYDFGFVMVFDDQQAYDTYNAHPDHVDFVENRWKKEVDGFLEIDFVNY